MQPVKTRSEENPTSKGKIKRWSSEGKIRRRRFSQWRQDFV